MVLSKVSAVLRTRVRNICNSFKLCSAVEFAAEAKGRGEFIIFANSIANI